MVTKHSGLGIRVLVGTAVAAVPVAAACEIGPTYDQWAATDGAAGRINMDDVQDAFKSSESPTEFEKKVNEIYEGDGIILVRAKQDELGLTVEGWEDLNDNYEIDDSQDDLLFTVVKKDENHEMRGYGANGYYRSGFGSGDFLFTYLMISSLTPRGYYYSTNPSYARTTITNQRKSYRQSNRYRSQVSRNSRHFNTQKKYKSSQYSSAARNTSTARTSYLSKQKSTGSFKTSGTGVRSSWGAGSRSTGHRGGRGGFRGGGGGQNIIHSGL